MIMSGQPVWVPMSPSVEDAFHAGHLVLGPDEVREHNGIIYVLAGSR